MRILLSRVLLCASFLILGLTRAQIAVELTDDNFEHDTQATTGSTTGDWLILFCEFERFKKCRDYEPFWQELAGLLRGKTTVAYINVYVQTK